jgi:hypothetical protein
MIKWQVMDTSGSHGFIYTVPEPATLLLFGLGAVRLRSRQSLLLRKRV